LFGVVLYSVFENSGLQFTSPATASMLVAAIPVFILILESAFTRRWPDWITALCIFLSIGGVWLVLFDGGTPDLARGSLKGNLLVLAAMACWIIYTFLSKKLGQRYSSLKLTTIQTLCALLLFFPFSVGEMHRWHLPSLTASLHLIFLGVFCSAIAYVLYLYGINVMGSVIPSTFLNLCPVVTILAGFLILGEIPTWVQLTGALLIIGSLTALSLIKVARIRKSASLPDSAEATEEQARRFMEV
jgi:drug/metabolite transporter (DMT)-like permease